MALVKRGNIWWSEISVKGIRHRKSTKTRNRRWAEAVDRRHKEELTFFCQYGLYLNPEMQFCELATRFLSSAACKPWHRERLKMSEPFFGHLVVGNIKKNDALEFRRWRHQQKQVTEATINRDLQCVRRVLNWAQDEGLIAANPLTRLPLEPERRKYRPVMGVEDELALLAAADEHLRPVLIMALDTGMRRGELLAQRWDHVDFGRRLLCVTHSKTAGGESREIPLTTRLFNWLWENRENEGLIFPLDGRPIYKLRTAWKAAMRRAQIRRYRFHDLRHSFATRLLEAGVLREVRQELMGHSTGRDVHSVYAHVGPHLKRDAIRKLEVWLEKERS